VTQPTKAQIIEALEKSGYFFEQDVATALENMDFHVETNYAYTDLDEDKSREIDVRAIKEIHRDDGKKVQVFVELLVECKDFGSPLVFLERAKNTREKDYAQPNEYIFPKARYKEQINEKSYTEHHPLQYFNLSEKHYYFNEPNKATQFSKIYRKSSNWFANHEGIYDSLILPQAKLLESRKKEVVSFCRSGVWKGIWLFFPMVVLRDNLFTYDLSGPERLLQEKTRVSFVRQLDSSNLKGSYLTDFVTYNHLSDYICVDVARFSTAVLDTLNCNSAEVLGI